MPLLGLLRHYPHKQTETHTHTDAYLRPLHTHSRSKPINRCLWPLVLRHQYLLSDVNRHTFMEALDCIGTTTRCKEWLWKRKRRTAVPQSFNAPKLKLPPTPCLTTTFCDRGATKNSPQPPIHQYAPVPHFLLPSVFIITTGNAQSCVKWTIIMHSTNTYSNI